MTTSKVEINSDTAQPTQQEQVDVLKKEGVNLETMQDANGNRVEVSTPDTQPQGIQNERPEWLPEKFKTAEDLSKAYTELEKQFSQKQNEPVEEQATEETSGEVSDNFSVDKYANEYAEKGELSNNSYNELAKQGLSKDLVDGYIAGQKSIADTQTSQIQEVAGGQQQYGELINWASQNLSEAEQQSFNDLTETGSIDQIKLAVQGLMTRAGMTNSPVQQEMLQGDVNNVSVDQFNSVQQVTDAMNDPRYEKDPVFRKEVERKLANSSVF